MSSNSCCAPLRCAPLRLLRLLRRIGRLRLLRRIIGRLRLLRLLQCIGRLLRRIGRLRLLLRRIGRLRQAKKSLSTDFGSINSLTTQHIYTKFFNFIF